MLREFGTNSVQLRERKNGSLAPKRHQMKHLDFLILLLESRRSVWGLQGFERDNVFYRVRKSSRNDTPKTLFARLLHKDIGSPHLGRLS